jgi:hypothetical protein
MKIVEYAFQRRADKSKGHYIYIKWEDDGLNHDFGTFIDPRAIAVVNTKINKYGLSFPNISRYTD